MFARYKCSALRTGAAILVGLASFAPASAGQFEASWDNLDWPVNSIGPQTYTITDEFGFELQIRIGITRIGGAALNGYPDDRLGFGTQESLWVVWDPSFGNGNVGDSTNTATFEILSGGAPFPIDGWVFDVSDIDSVDNNATTDRCDFVTLTGNAGNPALSLKLPVSANTAVVIGPGPGSGATGALAANQAQCIYNVGPPGSPNSNADDNGTIIASYPAGTHTINIAYDESMSDVIGNNNINPAARGGGFFASTIISSNSTISLDKSTAATGFTAVGDVVSYDYVITNAGPLPINTGQNFQISDDKIGIFNCGTIAADIPVNGTHTCSANYTVTAADFANGAVTNVAIAGLGTGTQPFADRLQSNTDAVTLLDTRAVLVASKSIQMWDPGAIGVYALPSNDVIYTIAASNTGGGSADNDSIELIDSLPAEIEFYNGDIDDAGPETNPVSFTQTSGAGLTFNYATDVGFSNSATKPADFAECTYTPVTGYDLMVTYICFAPKGALTAGDPDPGFSVSFRARIK